MSNKNKNLSINVEFLTRVEGHGHIIVDVKNGVLEKCQLNIVESPRFFEKMVAGRSVFEAPHITSRICGICSCGHTLASIQAAEDALNITPSKQTEILRKLLLYMEIMDSHLMHIYMLVIPDLLGADSAFQLMDTHGKIVRKSLAMKENCNKICEVLVGRHVHPISCVIGGFTKLPDKEDLDFITEKLLKLKNDLEFTMGFISELSFPDFQRETEYISLCDYGEEYPLLSGNICSSDGVKMSKNNYKSITNEFTVDHSTAKHARLSRDSYAVGALARFNLNYAKLSQNAKLTAEKLNIKSMCTNPYMTTLAQLVESVHCVDESLKIMDNVTNEGLDYSEVTDGGINETGRLKITSGEGVGAVEVPRGTLFHCYSINEDGIIDKADCVIPTSQNLRNIENDMRKFLPEMLGSSKDEIRKYLEMLVRAYDPCISCSTHALKVEFTN